MDSKQLTLPISWAFSKSNSDFIVSECNRYAYEWLEKWPFKVLDNFVCLVGESGSGKTHLSYLWALRQNAEIIYSSKNNVFNTWYNISSSEDPQRYFVLDDADQLNDDILLFYIYNTIKEKDCYLLMTAKSHPNRWGLSLSDIKSRVSTINVINIKKPNDEAIVSMIEKMLLQRGISIKENVAKYISQRIERSYNSINNCVKQLDNKITDRKSKLSIQSVKEIL